MIWLALKRLAADTGILGGLVAALTAEVASETNAPVLKYTSGSKQVSHPLFKTAQPMCLACHLTNKCLAALS